MSTATIRRSSARERATATVCEFAPRSGEHRHLESDGHTTRMGASVAEWEAEIKIRRNGRLVKMERALGSSAEVALYNVHNDMELWAQEHVRITDHTNGGE